jgi:tight adherence protein B
VNALLVPVGLLAAAVGIGYYWLDSWRRDQVRSRLSSAETAQWVQLPERPFARRHWWVAWVVALIVFSGLVYAVACPVPIAVGICLVVALVGMEIDAWILEWRHGQIETQLADTIDVLVASVGAGSSLPMSLAQAAEYAPLPIKRELDEMVARLRLGDPPPDVFAILSERVPLETFRLFTTTLSVNWEAGGSLGETLAAIGNTIRERLIIARQIRALSTQGRLSSATVLAVTWFMAAMMWQTDPPRFVNFLLSETGIWLIAATLVLQGVGIAMVSKISRPKV